MPAFFRRYRAFSIGYPEHRRNPDLAEQIHALTKPLVDMDPQIEVRITVKAKADGDLAEANNVLNKIKPGWKL